MKSFRQFLLEKLILINNGARFGQIVIVLGGAGSGKGFAIKNFMENDKFKTLSVDNWKEALLKLCKDEKIKDPEICKLSLSNKFDVAKLHQIVKDRNIRNKVFDSIFGLERNKDVLPNIIFDITGKDINDITELAKLGKNSGYNTENIHIIYVLTNWKVAFKRNLQRERVVSPSVFLETTKGAIKTLLKIVAGELSSDDVDGSINIILNNPENMEFHNNSKTSIKDFTYLNLKQSSKPMKSSDELSYKIQTWIDNNAIPSSKIESDT